MISHRQRKAIEALLTTASRKKAAERAGVSTVTLYRYFQNDEFCREYKRATQRLIDEATRTAQKALIPAVSTLANIALDEKENAGARVSAARSIIEYGLRLTEFSDIMQDLESLNGDADVL